MRTRIKICGITNFEDARAAVDAGADALGFIFYSASPRYVSAETAAQIIRQVPPFISRVGVFVNAERDKVLNVAHCCGLDTLQFHGEESPAYCAQFPSYRIYKAFRIHDANSLNQLPAFQSKDVSAWLLDSFVVGQHGGTGARFNWDIARKAKELGKPIILAGGLTVENVGDAVEQVAPFAVDVSSGVEISPGKKDHKKLRAFIHAVMSADSSRSDVAVEVTRL